MVEFTSKSGNVYEMPELDAGMYAKQQAVDDAGNDIERKFAAAWAFVKAALPDECIMEEIGCTDKKKAGIPRIMSLCNRVKSTYWDEYSDEQISGMNAQIDALGGLPKIVDAMANAQRIMSNNGGRQVFRAVK